MSAGRPPRPYDPDVLAVVEDRLGDLRAAEAGFLASVGEAIAGGVPLRDIEDATGVSRTSLSRGVTARYVRGDTA